MNYSTPLWLAVGILLWLLVLAIFVFTIWMFIDIFINPRVEVLYKILWVLAIIAFGPIGAAVYYFVGRNGQTSSR